MKFKELISLLEEKNIEVKARNIKDNMEIFDMDFLGNDYVKDTSNIIFISNNSREEVPEDTLALLTTYPVKEDINFIELGEKDFSNAYHIMRRQFTRSIKEQINYYDILKNSLDGKGLDEIMEELTLEYGNQLAVIDLSGKILARSKDFRPKDPVWIKSLRDGFLPVEFMDHIGEIRRQTRGRFSEEAMESFCQATRTSYLCSRILVKNEVLGYVFMFNDENIFTDDAKKIILLISKLAAANILRDSRTRNMNFYLEKNILSDLLAGIDEENARARIRSLGMDFPKEMLVILVNPSHYLDEIRMDEINYELKEIFGESLSLIYHRNLVLLVENKKDYHRPDSLRKILEPVLENYNLSLGLSNAFPRPTDFPIYHDQARLALNYGEFEEEKIAYYRDYAFYDMLNKFPSRKDLESFIYPGLESLKAYDRKKGTELFETLRVYTATAYNKKESSEILFIHRNTLNYRREQIKEILGFDFEEEDILFQLSYSFKIYDYLTRESFWYK